MSIPLWITTIFLFTIWIFLNNQDPEDETLVLLNHFDFLMNVNYVYNVMNIICLVKCRKKKPSAISLSQLV